MNALLQAQREKLRAQLPEPDALFGWLRVQATETLVELLAFCVASKWRNIRGQQAMENLYGCCDL